MLILNTYKMKFKHIILIFGLFTFSQVIAQGGRENFDKMDRNGDSFVEIEEFKRFYLGKFNRTGGEINAEVLFNSKDLNGDKILTFSEYSQQGSRAFYNTKKGNKKRVNNWANDKSKTFKKIDVNKDEIIDISEFQSFFESKKNKKGEPINYKRFFKHIDINKNKEITLEEFLKPLRKKQE